MMFDLANSHLAIEVPCARRLHKHVIGAKGTRVQAIHKVCSLHICFD